MNIYTEIGFDDRNDYLQYLAKEHNTTFQIVHSIAEMLGEQEDFDGLVSSLEDFRCLGDDNV